MTDTEALGAIRREMEPLAPKVTEALNALLPEGGGPLASRWNGTVALFEQRGPTNESEGVMRRDGTIEIAASRINDPDRWRTYLHELVHAHSPLGSVDGYDQNRGWEEAVVELLQRRIRASVLADRGEIEETAIAQEEANWLFNPYITAIEKVRSAFGVSEDEAGAWYARLLGVPIENRRIVLMQQAVRSRNKKAVMEMSVAHDTLRRNIR